jgi:CheY-like chemotaxis protein
MRRMLAAVLKKKRYFVIELSDGNELLDHLRRLARPESNGSVALIITDHRMPGATGLEVLAHMRRVGLGIPLILITAFGEPGLHAEARRLGAAAVLDKPFELEDLVATVRALAPLRADLAGLPE